MPIDNREMLEGLTARALVAIAVRTARRTLLRYPPRVTLKRHQRMADNLNLALAVSEEFVNGTDCTMTFLRKLVHASDKVGAVSDDVRYGPNQLEMETSEANPIECVLEAVGAATNGAMAALVASMGEPSESEANFRGVVDRAYESLRWGIDSPEDMEVAHRIGGGRCTELGPVMDISDQGEFGPLE